MPIYVASAPRAAATPAAGTLRGSAPHLLSQPLVHLQSHPAAASAPVGEASCLVLISLAASTLLAARAAPERRRGARWLRRGSQRPLRQQRVAVRASAGKEEGDGLSIGIDFGTSTSAVAVRRPDGRFIVVPPEGAPPGRLTMPSVVAVNSKFDVVSGFAALRVKHDGVRQCVFSSFKRLLGRTYQEAREAGIDPGLYGADPDGLAHELVRLMMPGGQMYSMPEEAAAEIIRSLVRAAEAFTGLRVKRAVLGCPAAFDKNQRRALEKAAQLAGIEAMRTCPEPELAVRAYGLRIANLALRDKAWAGGSGGGDDEYEEYEEEEDDQGMPPERTQRHILVADLGGGTFDVSVVRQLVEVDELHMMHTHGDHHLGGDDFDADLMKWAETELKFRLPKTTSNLWPLTHENRRRLCLACRRAKERLSSYEDATVSFAGVTLKLNRRDMQAICIGTLRRMLEPIRVAAHASGVKLPWESVAVGVLETAAGVQVLGKTAREEQMEKMKRQLGANDLSPEEAAIDEVLCIGGATWSPCVRELLFLITASEPSAAVVDPETAVAVGAAALAAVMDGKMKDVQVQSSWRLAWAEYYMKGKAEDQEQGIDANKAGDFRILEALSTDQNIGSGQESERMALAD